RPDRPPLGGYGGYSFLFLFLLLFLAREHPAKFVLCSREHFANACVAYAPSLAPASREHATNSCCVRGSREWRNRHRLRSTARHGSARRLPSSSTSRPPVRPRSAAPPRGSGRPSGMPRRSTGQRGTGLSHPCLRARPSGC